MKKSGLIKIFMLVATMNFVDAILSNWGMKNGIMEEGNDLMKMLWEKDPVYFLVTKILLSISLLAVAFFYKKSEKEITKKIKIMAYIMLALYTYVMILHVIWITIM